MSKPTSQRPPQVTFAAGLAIGGSVFVVLENFSAVSGLRSLAARETIEKMVSEPPLSEFGLTVEQGLTVSYWSLVVGAVCAVAIAIFAWFTLQRSTQARLAMTLLAVPLFLSGLFNGGFLTALVAAAVTFLWMPPGREWFRDGVWTPPSAPAPREVSPPPEQQAPGAPPVPPADGGGSDAPAHPGWLSGPGPSGPGQPYTLGGVQQPGQQPGQPPAGPPRHVAPPYAPRPQRPLVPRPPQLLSVLLLTVLGGIGATISYVLQALNTDPADMIAQFREIAPQLFADSTPEMVRASLWMSVAMVVLWSLAAVVLALLVMRRQQWARILLIVSAALVAPYGILAGIAGSGFMLVAGVCAVAALFLLRAPAVNEWFRP